MVSAIALARPFLLADLLRRERRDGAVGTDRIIFRLGVGGSVARMIPLRGIALPQLLNGRHLLPVFRVVQTGADDGVVGVSGETGGGRHRRQIGDSRAEFPRGKADIVQKQGAAGLIHRKADGTDGFAVENFPELVGANPVAAPAGVGQNGEVFPPLRAVTGGELDPEFDRIIAFCPSQQREGVIFPGVDGRLGAVEEQAVFRRRVPQPGRGAASTQFRPSAYRQGEGVVLQQHERFAARGEREGNET